MAPLSPAQPGPRLTGDVVAVMPSSHLVQALLGGRVPHCDGAILVVSNVGPGGLPRGIRTSPARQTWVCVGPQFLPAPPLAVPGSPQPGTRRQPEASG